MNKVILIGTVAYPPRYNETNYGAVVNMMVKTTHRYKNAQGEIVERQQQNKASLWGKLAELYRDTRQGDLVSLEGRLQNKKTQDEHGVEKWETGVVCNAFEILVTNKGGEQPGVPDIPDDIPDDDIPF